MEPRKLVSAALFLTLLGSMLILPPLALLFQLQHRVLGVPAEVIYLFVCWAALVAGAWWLGRYLPHEPESAPEEDEG